MRHLRNAAYQGASPSVRELMRLMGYRSPQSISRILQRLQDWGFIRRNGEGRIQLLKGAVSHCDNAVTVDVPLVGSAPCGAPLLAEQNVECFIPVSVELAAPPHAYFLLRTTGDSMNLAGIQDGDLVLVRKQVVADSGERVVALVDGQATIKRLRKERGVVLLEPQSTNKRHRPIIAHADFRVQGVVVTAVPNKMHSKLL